MSTLVFLEHNGSNIQKGSLGVLSKAASLDPDTAGVLVGNGVAGLAEIAAKHGAAKVYVVDDAAFEAPLPQPRVDAIAKIVADNGIDTVLFGASVLSADIAGGLSARTDGGLNWDLSDIEGTGDATTGKRAALGDSVYVDVGWTATPRIGLFRSGSFDPVENAAAGEVVSVDASAEDFSAKASLVSQEGAGDSAGPAIEEAEILVTGGRGLGSPEGFGILEELAKALGGAVASTRAVVDSGWYPYATQIGQTGKTVAPKLYIGCGVSGAIQHKVGMQSSQTIVSINKDGTAPIFDFSDLGVVGDLHQVVPKLTEKVRERKG